MSWPIQQDRKLHPLRGVPPSSKETLLQSDCRLLDEFFCDPTSIDERYSVHDQKRGSSSLRTKEDFRRSNRTSSHRAAYELVLIDERSPLERYCGSAMMEV